VKQREKEAKHQNDKEIERPKNTVTKKRNRDRETVK
jgi:hypothetical protein